MVFFLNLCPFEIFLMEVLIKTNKCLVVSLDSGINFNNLKKLFIMRFLEMAFQTLSLPLCHSVLNMEQMERLN